MIERFEKDGLFFHKIGLILGTIGGLLIGLVVSDRADQYQVEVEEVPDYGKDADGNWPRVKIEKEDSIDDSEKG